MSAWTYMFRCGDGSFYVGSTRSLQVRHEQHDSGLGGEYTKKRQPVELVYAEEFVTLEEAALREVQLKGWTRRKKAALAAMKWPALKQFARGLNAHQR